MELREFCQELFARGKKLGFQDMEVYAKTGQEFEVSVYEQEIDNYSVSQFGGLSFRSKYNGKFGYAYTEHLDETTLDFLVKSARDNAQVIDEDDAADIYPGAAAYPEVKVVGGNQTPTVDKIAFTKTMEALALSLDPRVQSVNHCFYADASDAVSILNSKGLDLTHRSYLVVAGVSVVVKEGDRVKTAGKYKFGTSFDKLSAEELAKQAVEEAVSLLDARQIPSGRYPVILRNDVAATLLQTFGSVFSAENAQKGLSLLQHREGELIASEKVTLVDDPLLTDGACTTPFDAEGVAARRKEVISHGVLKTLLHNLKTAGRAGIASTGNAVKASYKSGVGVAPTNFYIQPSTDGISLSQLLEAMGDGLLIIDVQGMHSGANPVSGDFSLSAVGYLVKQGKIAQPVEQITIAGNFYDVLKQVEEVASDLEFGLPSSLGVYGSPSLLLPELSVAGE